MLIYYSIFVVMIMAFLAIEKKYFENIYYLAIFLIFVYFPVIVGLNSDRVDYINYVDHFNQLPRLFTLSYFSSLLKATGAIELGYAFFASVVKTFSNSATVFFVILCFLSFYFRFRFVKYFACHKEDILLIFFAFFAHEFLRKDAIQIRNGIASAIVLFSFISLYRGYRTRFVIWVLFASLFHVAAFVSIPLVVLNAHLDTKTLRNMRCIFLIALLSVFVFSIMDFLLFLKNFGFLPSRLILYMQWDYFNNPLSIYHPTVLRQITICFVFLFILHKHINASNPVAVFLFKIYLVSTLYYIVFLDFAILSGRFGSLFSGVETVFFLQVINTNLVRRKVLFKIGVLSIAMMTFIVNLVMMPRYLGFEATFQ